MSSFTLNSERLWRSSGIIFAVFFVLAYVMYGLQPKAGASAETLVSFYEGHRMRILMASMFFGTAVLFLLWFAAAIRSALHDAGQGGWGAAATASSAALGGMLWVLIALGAALAYSIVGLGNGALSSGLNDLAWTCIVVSSFPRALLIMAGTFGLLRAKLISNALFGAGVAAVVLVLVGGTTWASGGIWAPSGEYTRFVSPIIGIVWIRGLQWGPLGPKKSLHYSAGARATGGGAGAVVRETERGAATPRSISHVRAKVRRCS